jgi:hypothetical protein
VADQRTLGPVDFTIEVSLAHPPEAVQDALLDQDFIHSTANLPKLGGAEVLECTRNGQTARVRVRYKFTAPLSKAITSVIDPDKLTWVDDATVDVATYTSRHQLLPDNYADRLDAHYNTVLTPDGSGARWTLRGSLVVHAPLVGGKVAAAIVEGLREAAAAKGTLLDEWLAKP